MDTSPATSDTFWEERQPDIVILPPHQSSTTVGLQQKRTREGKHAGCWRSWEVCCGTIAASSSLFSRRCCCFLFPLWSERRWVCFERQPRDETVKRPPNDKHVARCRYLMCLCDWLNSCSDVLTLEEAQCAFVLLLMTVFWITELIPLSMTAMFPAILFPMFGIMKSSAVSLCTWSVSSTWKYQKCLYLIIICSGCSPFLTLDLHYSLVSLSLCLCLPPPRWRRCTLKTSTSCWWASSALPHLSRSGVSTDGSPWGWSPW